MEIRALAFDVFGTVVDWRSSVAAEVAAIAVRHGLTLQAGTAEAFADAWRARYQPSMDRVRRGEIGWTALDDLHRASLEELLEGFGLGSLDARTRDELNLAWHRLRPWPDAVEGLTRLRHGHALCTLSNGNVALLVDLARFGGLPFDCIISAELCQAYKPDPRTYRMVPALLRLRPEQAMMVAAHPSDLRAAAAEGLRTALVPRPLEWGPGGGGRGEPAAEGFDVVAGDFVELAQRLSG
ncbi:MAG TPA: haloacid dehalogenase type II, partial [Candidatus Eisenbacteria bacterium]|nr:haloacid dehalogenase type II [Candidatus Eisenbacteria bacterium]